MLLSTTSQDVLVAVIDQMPALLAVLIAGVVLWHTRGRWAALIDRITRVRAGAFEISIGVATLEAARPNAPVPRGALNVLEVRLERNARVLHGARILWVDDDRSANRTERSFLRLAGAEVTKAASIDEAVAAVEREDFDLLITDLRHGHDPRAGVSLVAAVQSLWPVQAIAYVGTARSDQGLPPFFRAVVDRPDQLIHAILDQLESTRV